MPSRATRIVFENAVSHVPLTLPSHVSLFTGLLPFQNGVRDNLGYRLDPSRETLAACSRVARIRDGGGRLGGRARRQNRRRARDSSSATTGSRARSADSRWARCSAPEARRRSGWRSGSRPSRPESPSSRSSTSTSRTRRTRRRSPWKSRYPKSAYDGEIAASDEIVGRWIAFLKERDLYERALVVFLSDHGEGLGEHGEDEHGILLYRETVRVPLFVKLPGQRLAGTRVAAPAGIADVLPDGRGDDLGEKAPAGLPGVSLVALAESAREAALEPLQRDSLPALPLRLERSRFSDRRPLTSTSRPRARSSTTGARTRARRGSRRRASARVPHAPRGAVRDESPAPGARRLRSGDREEARVARLHRPGLSGRRREELPDPKIGSDRSRI